VTLVCTRALLVRPTDPFVHHTVSGDSIPGLLLTWTSLFLPFAYTITILQMYFAFGSLVQYSGACFRVAKLWMHRETAVVKAYGIACTFGVTTLTWSLHKPNDLHYLIGIVSLLGLNLLAIFAQEVALCLRKVK